MTGEQMPPAQGNLFPYADRIKTVSTEDPFKWLVAGLQDFRRAGVVSFAYGAMFVVAGLVLTVGLYMAGFEHLIAPLIAGFLLVGPALTVGLYAISRDMEAGQKPGFWRAVAAWRSNTVHLLALGLCLVLFLIIWMRLAVMIFALSFPYESTSIESIVTAALFTVQGNIFLLIGTAVGGVMATLAFMMSVFSLPMLLDRRVDIIEAVVVSVVAVLMNIRVMAIWAALIVLFQVAGLITGYIGLIVTLPLIGHASWHAYRAVIVFPDSKDDRPALF